VTASQVKAIIDRLAEQNPNDTSLNDFAGSVDESTCQDIADAANAAKSGETTSDSTDGDTTDTSTDGTSSEGSDTSSTDTTTTVTTN
jgi:hypothetical protein